jgi:hypothetical protein
LFEGFERETADPLHFGTLYLYLYQNVASPHWRISALQSLASLFHSEANSSILDELERMEEGKSGGPDRMTLGDLLEVALAGWKNIRDFDRLEASESMKLLRRMTLFQDFSQLSRGSWVWDDLYFLKYLKDPAEQREAEELIWRLIQNPVVDPWISFYLASFVFKFSKDRSLDAKWDRFSNDHHPFFDLIRDPKVSDDALRDIYEERSIGFASI